MSPRSAGFIALALACFCAPALLAQTDPVPALEKRKGEAGFGSLVLKAAEAAPNLAETIRILSALAPLAKGGDTAILYRELAPLLELESRFIDASLAWENAARAHAKEGPLWFAYAATCALYGGDAERALALASVARLLPGHDAAKLNLVSAWALCLKGDASAALSSALAVIASGDTRYEPDALALAAALCDGAEREGYLARLESRYPHRPGNAGLPPVLILRLASLSDAQIVKPESPGASLRPGAQDAAAAKDSTISPPEDTSPVAYYQVGAYRSRDNAEAMIKRLKDKGFSPGLSARKDASGADIFLVYVAAGADGDTMLLKLKDAGFEAWPLAGSP